MLLMQGVHIESTYIQTIPKRVGLRDFHLVNYMSELLLRDIALHSSDHISREPKYSRLNRRHGRTSDGKLALSNSETGQQIMVKQVIVIRFWLSRLCLFFSMLFLLRLPSFCGAAPSFVLRYFSFLPT
jgi:hypothetical protein